MRNPKLPINVDYLYTSRVTDKIFFMLIWIYIAALIFPMDCEKIYASVRFLKIGDINTKNQQFTAIIDLTFRWNMELLSERVASYQYLDSFLAHHQNEGPLGFSLVRLSHLYVPICLRNAYYSCSRSSSLREQARLSVAWPSAVVKAWPYTEIAMK